MRQLKIFLYNLYKINLFKSSNDDIFLLLVCNIKIVFNNSIQRRWNKEGKISTMWQHCILPCKTISFQKYNILGENRKNVIFFWYPEETIGLQDIMSFFLFPEKGGKIFLILKIFRVGGW